MVKLILTVLVASSLLLLHTPGRTESPELREKTASYEVTVSFDKGRPVEGRNEVKISVKDGNGASVKGAQVVIDYLMPSLPGKAPMMEYAVDAKPDDGKYRATVKLEMKGQWKMIIAISSGSQKEAAVFNFTVG